MLLLLLLLFILHLLALENANKMCFYFLFFWDLVVNVLWSSTGPGTSGWLSRLVINTVYSNTSGLFLEVSREVPGVPGVPSSKQVPGLSQCVPR